MSLLIVCSSCGADVRLRPTVTGDRTDGWSGGRPLPDGEFHWCVNCALLAFASLSAALESARARDLDLQAAVFKAARAVNPSVAARPAGGAS